MRITTKDQMWRLMAAGKLGNTVQVWFSVAEALASGHPGPFNLRDTAVGGTLVYSVTRRRLAKTARDFGMDPGRLYVFPEPPHDQRLFQGEASRDVGGLHLLVSWLPVPMRQALAEGGRHFTGAAAELVLRDNLNNHADELEALWEAYPGAVIEFTLFQRDVGIFRKPLLIWEVRHY